jgi:hypothetical protein
MVKIYLITNCFDNPNKVYIGKTKNYTGKNKDSRKKSHKRTYGKNIIYTIIDEIDSTLSKDWKPLETYWIQQFKVWGFDVLNKNEGGGGVDTHTSEARNTIREKAKNREYALEWRLNISAATKGKPKNHPPDRGNNISISKKGKPNPKLSESRTNQPHPKVGWKVNQLNEQGECIKEWESSKHAGEALNIAPDLIRAAARGVQKTAGGFIWKYKEN